MAALVQPLPPSSATMTMLQTRPASSEAFQNSSQGQQHHRSSQMPMNIYNTSVGGMAAGNYRGNTTALPMSPFGLQNPLMNGGSNPLRQHPSPLQQHPRYDNRSASTPSLPTFQQLGAGTSSRPRPSASPSNTSTSSKTFVPLQHNISSDSSSFATFGPKSSSNPLATLDLNVPSTQAASYANVAKAAPDRYKRNHRRAETANGLISTPQSNSAVPSGSGMATVGHLYTQPQQSSSTPALSTYPTYRGVPSPDAAVAREQVASTHRRLSSQDDFHLQSRPPSNNNLAKRYRRASVNFGSIEPREPVALSEGPSHPPQPKTYAAMLASPAPTERKEPRMQRLDRPPVDGRRDSSESGSAASSSAKSFSVKKGTESQMQSNTQQATQLPKHEAKVVNVPARGSSEPVKRVPNPSPLSKPLSVTSNNSRSQPQRMPEPIKSAPLPAPTPASALGLSESPAAQQLAALNKKDAKKEGKSSRLRRAFSFGSAAELRKASAENSANNARERNKLQKPQFADEEEAQQAAIVQQQEASGLGESIYSGQGHFFTGSTDNLSISSTASSASVMIRKMGKGVKKGSRSLVGLFRPKSVVGVPAADSAVPEPSVAQVSMVTVEAEREKVNVNVNPHDQPGGGTGFPKLERNSLEATFVTQEAGQSTTDETASRRSIVGGERERAEVLATIKKGILKRSGTDSGSSSPQPRQFDAKGPPNFNLPQIPRVNDSPNSSAPSTPVDEHTPRGQAKTDLVQIEGEEYFLNIQHYANGSSTSMPTTPRGTLNRNISFSPRIIFHDTWPSAEYDRRGEIATCNRLTPMLAQQIKEELNSFKMEMEVHNESKINTHFF